MNQPMHWSLEQVADIPRERSGKIRLCVSEIPPPDSILANTLLTPKRPETQLPEPLTRKRSNLAS
jgi:hypothetical protein